MTQSTWFMTSLQQLIQFHTAKFMFVRVRNNKTEQVRFWNINRIHTKCCCISKISNSVGRNDNFLAKAPKLSIVPISLDIFDIRNTIYIRILCIVIDCLTVSCFTAFQHYFSHYSSGVPYTILSKPSHYSSGVPYTILSKPLAAFPHNHCRNNGQRPGTNPVAMTLIIGENFGRGRDRTSDHLSSGHVRHRLS